jgi:hypothetical protein
MSTRVHKMARAARQPPTLHMGDSLHWSDRTAPDVLAAKLQAPKADAGSPKAGVRPGQAVLLDCCGHGRQSALATVEQRHPSGFMSDVKG